MASEHDMKSLSVAELRKRLDQQKRLLQNRALLSSLPDGGEKVRRKVAELESAISSKHGLEETMEQLRKMHLGEDRGRVEGRRAEERGKSVQAGRVEEGGKDEGKKSDGQRRKFVDLQAALRGQGECWDSDDEDETTDSQHISAVKSLDGLPVHMEAKVGLGMGPRENVSSDPQHRTDQEKLAAVRQRIQLRSARRAQTLSIDESLKLQVEQQKREEELRTEFAAAQLMETVGTVSIGMPPRAGRAQYRDAAVSSVQEQEDDSVSDPSDLSSDEDDLVGEEIHF